MTAIEIMNGRPDDEKYLSLWDLYAFVKCRAEHDRDGSDGFSAQSPDRCAQALH